jgi:peptidylprolyl isomerase
MDRKEQIMAPAKIGDVVKVHYTGKLDDGTIFDDSLNREPLKFQTGAHLLLEDFEQAVIGMNVGDWKTVKIPADKAYGPHLKEMVLAAEPEKLPKGMKPFLGQQLQIISDDGQSLVVTVIEITDAKVILDANHPLSGKDLTFEINLVEIIS